MMHALRALGLVLGAVIFSTLGAPAAQAQGDCSSLNPGVNRCSIQTAQGTRTFTVVVPQNVRPNAVMLGDFHGFGGSENAAFRGSGLAQLVERSGFVYVAPSGLGRSWRGRAGCCGQAQQRRIDDVAFVRQAFGVVERALNIQPEARFAHGISNGGDLMNRLACEAADFFDGVQSTSFQFSALAGCRPSQSIAYQEVHATADNVVPFNGGLFRTLRAPEATEQFAQVQRCNVGQATQRRVNSNTVCRSFPGCQDGVVVEMCTVTPGNHSIFPTIGARGDEVRFVDLSLDFFQRELDRLRRTRGAAGAQ